MAKVTVSPTSEESILSAAEAVFRRAGFARGTIRDIATQCGMSVGAVASLGSKDELLVRVVERRIAALQEVGETRADPGGTVSLPDDILRYFERFYKFFEQEWDLATEYLAILVSGRHRADALEELADELVRQISARLAADGRSAKPARETAESIYLAYLGSLLGWVMCGRSARTQSFASLSRAVHTLVAGAWGMGE